MYVFNKKNMIKLLFAVISSLIIAEEKLPDFLKDRGTGVTTSMFGHFIQKGELVVYPFIEYFYDSNYEYQPLDFGYDVEEDYLAKYSGSSEQLFLGYGFHRNIALELGISYQKISFEKPADDNSDLPAKIEEKGFGDIESQLRFRLLEETKRSPEVFSFLNLTVPTQKDKILLHDKHWDIKLGLGFMKGFPIGTFSLHTDLEYNHVDSHFDVGETSLRYLRRLADKWRMMLGIEGGETGAIDEWELISTIHYQLSELITIKADNSYGISPKAIDFTTAFGIMCTF